MYFISQDIIVNAYSSLRVYFGLSFSYLLIPFIYLIRYKWTIPHYIFAHHIRTSCFSFVSTAHEKSCKTYDNNIKLVNTLNDFDKHLDMRFEQNTSDGCCRMSDKAKRQYTFRFIIHRVIFLALISSTDTELLGHKSVSFCCMSDILSNTISTYSNTNCNKLHIEQL